MIDLDEIQIKQVIDMLPLRNKKDKGDYVLSLCEYHNDKNPSMSIVYRGELKGLVKCFSCGYTTNLYKLCYKLIGKSVNKLLNIKTENYLEYNFRNSLTKKEICVNNIHNDLTVNGSINSIYSNRDAYAYLRSRGFDDKTLNHFDVGFVSQIEVNGKVYWDRIYIPVYFENELVNIEFRKYKGDGLKTLYPKNSRTDILFNYDNLDKEKELIITEGIFDCLTLYKMGFENVTSIFGTSYKPNQTLLLDEFKKKVFCLDNDNAGWEAIKSYSDNSKYNFDVMVLPEGKDPNDCDFETIRVAYNKRISDLDYFFNKYFKKQDVVEGWW